MVLLASREPLSLRRIVAEVPGYPTGSEVAYRQAFERDKKLLRQEGVPILTEKLLDSEQLGYRIPPEDYYLPELDLSPSEQVALNLAVAGVHLPDGSATDALLKLGVVGSREGASLADLPVPAALPELHKAIAARSWVTFTYRGVDRTLDPYGLAFRGGNWYLLGRDHDRDALRSFRPDRMVGDVKVGPADSFNVPSDFDPFRALPRAPWTTGGGDVVEALVRIDPSHAGMAEAELGSGAVVERASDGSVIFTLAVSNRAAFRSWLFGYLDHAVVLAPPDLRGEVVASLTALAKELDT